MTDTTHVETIVIGAGQAGLATGYHLARREHPFLILDAHDRVGDVWRNRFDSLRLYSPAKYDGLPGWGIPAKGWSWPSKDEVADYLEAYAARFSLPVRTGTAVDSLSRDGDGFVVTSGEHRFTAANVVVASGTWQAPKTPGFADQLDPGIVQLHSNDYRNPGQLQPGAVLVVGASHSGADIAHELAATRPTYLCGPIHGQIPFAIEGRVARGVLPVMWFLANHVLTERTPIGRKMQVEVRGGGGPLLRVKRADLDRAGVTYHPEKVVGVRDGRPELADGTVLDVANVVWCTGFGKDTGWITFACLGADGWPDQKEGVATGVPGLYFVGLPFLRSFSSMLIGGVGRDAESVARHITMRRGADRRGHAGAGGRAPRLGSPPDGRLPVGCARVSRRMVLRPAVARLVLRLSRWKTVGEVPGAAILVGAPHTSNWDWVAMLLLTWRNGVQARVLVKRELFRGPLAPVLRATGGIPLDRDNPGETVRALLAEAEHDDSFLLVLAAEGTRGKAEHWKSGFYRMAQQTGLPVALGFVDGPTRTIGFGPSFHPTGDVAADMDLVRAFYADKHGIRPALRTEPRLRDEAAR